ncbi:hypothetical protein M378DRAFT_154704 [Amanita muscaria Koide BX008]|uniref:Uncharacterized protein n=1 Tax=Amanita muscaria (strain Koide BX008) TaxID=946122 RepID=A0A0C2XNP3_AMAMK|nr:hypothetical protein M378DRAFT_154704 [Amanita muscaria Koide BX008]
MLVRDAAFVVKFVFPYLVTRRPHANCVPWSDKFLTRSNDHKNVHQVATFDIFYEKEEH